MDEQEFQAKLEAIKVDHMDYRPFVCPGHPFDARLFIVGLNPATPGLPNWWDFWDSEQGFDFERFERRNRLYRSDKSSETRIRMNYLRDGVGPDVVWVETNLYPIASKNQK